MTRAMRFAVSFPGWREADLKGKSGLFYELAVVQGELTRAGNQTLSALYLVETGALPRPAKENGAPVSSLTLAYQALSGAWEPFGPDRPVYRPKGRRLCGAGLSELANVLHTRIKTDLKAIRSGEKSLATCRSMPLPVRADGVRVYRDDKTGRVLLDLQLWGGRGNNRLVVAPVLGPREHGQRELFERLLAGTYKYGPAKLFKDARTGKWTVTLAWSGDVAPAAGELLAGIDLNILTTASLAFVRLTDGKPVGGSERVQLPTDAIRAWNRVDTERRDRLGQGKAIYQRRVGRGVARHLRPIEVLAERRDRVSSTAVEETAAAVVRAAMKRGAVGIAFEDLTGLTDRVMDESEEMSRMARSTRRRFFLNGLLGSLREAIGSAARREGLAVYPVRPEYTNRTCSACGVVWKTPERGFGRIKDEAGRDTFRCECGASMHAHRNASLNIAKRGREEHLSAGV